MSAGDDRIPPGPAEGDAADAWLRAALRHAPDADVGAPPALSAAILRQAVAATSHATRRPAPPSAVQRLMAAWSWLAQPPVAAGFASVMRAGVVGLMWWDKPLDGALPARAPEVSVVPVPPVAAPPIPATPQAAAKVAPPQAVSMGREAAPAPAGAAATPAVTSAERRRTAPEAALGKARPAAPAPVPALEPARREATEALADAAPPLAQARAQAPAPPAQAALAAPAPMAAGAAAPIVTAEAPAKLSARSREARHAAPPAPLLTELRAAIRTEPQRWSWQRGAGAEQPMTAALRAWLVRLGDGGAADTLAPASASPSPSPSPSAPTTELRLLRDGQLHTTLELGSASLRVTPADARRAPLQTALSPQAAAELKASLDTAAP